MNKNVKMWWAGYNAGFCGKKPTSNDSEYKAGYRVGKADMLKERCF